MKIETRLEVIKAILLCILFVIALFIMLMLNLPYITAYEEQHTVIDNNEYYIYDVYFGDVPIQINKTLYNLYYNNLTNHTNYQIKYGDYITAVNNFTSTPDNQSINIQLNFDDDEIGEYETHIEVLDAFNNTINQTFFRFNVNYGDSIDVNYTAIPMGLISPGLVYYEVWDSELPKTIVTQHNIKSFEGYYLSINCTNDVVCSDNYTETEDIVTFSSTLTIPESKNIGTYTSMIHINTSYNKTGNITVRYKVKDTPIQVIETEILKTKSIDNMTEEELIDYWKQIKDASNEAIAKIESSKPEEKIIEKNVTVPYLANKDELVNAIMKEFAKRINEMSIRLAENIYKDGEKYRKQYYGVLDKLILSNATINNLTNKNNELKNNNRMLKNQNKLNLINLNNSIYEKIYKKNFVLSKHNVFISLLIIILLVGLMVKYVKYEKQAVGGL